MLDDLKAAPTKTVGMKETIKSIQSGRALKVFLARDVDEYIMTKIRDNCAKYNVPIVMVDSMRELGKACNIQVGASTAAIVK